MQQPKNRSEKYEDLFSDIDKGRIKIPQFQREFVWGKVRSAKLIDSLIKGFPIGTFILWKTQDRLRHIRNLGNVDLPDTPSGEPVNYVLDGQQRLTSLYAVRKGIILTREGREVDYRDICIRLDLDPDADEEVVLTEPPEDKSIATISVHELLEAGIAKLVKKFPNHVDTIDAYQKRLKGYDFSTIVIDSYAIDIACEVFTRINTGGQELTLFEIMVAKTYDHERDFDLAREYDSLLNSQNGDKDLAAVSYDLIPSVTILQCVAAHLLGKEIRRRDILTLDKVKFIDAWPTVTDGVFAAVDYLRSHLKVTVARLLPYNALLIPFTYFFIRNKFEMPSHDQHLSLKQYFFWAALTNRFTSAVETKIGEDLKRMDRILKGKKPSYRGEVITINPQDLVWRRFSTGDAFCQAVLCLFCQAKPKSFKSNGELTLDNSWLRQSNSRNYHHFFPRAYLKKKGRVMNEINVLMNITLVDDYLNKRVIKAQPPSKYMKAFKKTNPRLDHTIQSHLITGDAVTAYQSDDYEAFLVARAETVAAALNEALEG